MKAHLFLPLVAVLLTSSIHAEDPTDLRGPKSEQPRLLRVLLHLPGSARLIDYPDVERIVCCEATRIVFETQDGHLISHHGTFTVILPRNASANTSDGRRFYDIR